MSKVFNQLDSVVSLSEPDVFSQLVIMRNPDGSDDAEIVSLLKSCISWLAKPMITGQTHSVLKFRSFCIELGDLISQVFPQTKAIFLYRNAENVVKSAIRAFGHITEHYSTHALRKNIDFLSRFTPLLKEYINYIEGKPSVIDSETISWLSIMHRYLFLYHQQKTPFCAVRYEELVAKPQQTVSALFDYCGLPITEINQISTVFQEYSQQGAALSREALLQVDLPDALEIRQKMEALLKKINKFKYMTLLYRGL